MITDYDVKYVSVEDFKMLYELGYYTKDEYIEYLEKKFEINNIDEEF